MVCDLEATTFEDQAVWRVGHAPTPWRFTDWAHADQHGRFDGRWDDPAGSYSRAVHTEHTIAITADGPQILTVP